MTPPEYKLHLNLMGAAVLFCVALGPFCSLLYLLDIPLRTVPGT